MSEAFAAPFPPEFHEQAMLSGLLEVLQDHHVNALQFQQDQLEAHSKALQPMRATNYVVSFLSETPEIPARHDRIIFGPQYHSPPYSGVSRIIARFPLTHEEVYPDHTVDSDVPGERVPTTKPWNDVFLEIVDEDDGRQNYLLNSKGLVAFDDADHVGADMDFAKTDDLFVVQRPVELPRVTIDLFTLSYLLNYKPGNVDAYVYHPQTNEAEPPKYF